MSQQSYRLVEADVFAAQLTAHFLLGLTLGKLAPRHTVDQVFQEVLTDHRNIYNLTERQRIIALRLCKEILDKVYEEQE